MWRAANDLVACADERAQRGTRGGEAYRKTAGVRCAVEGAGAPGGGEPTRSHSLLSAQKVLTGTVAREATRQQLCSGDPGAKADPRCYVCMTLAVVGEELRTVVRACLGSESCREAE